jgi:hypothetical protein
MSDRADLLDANLAFDACSPQVRRSWKPSRTNESASAGLGSGDARLAGSAPVGFNRRATVSSSSSCVLFFITSVVSRLERQIIALGLVVILGICLIPPWKETFARPGAAPTERPLGYFPIWSPPEPTRVSRAFGVKIDVTRMTIQLLGVVGGTLGLAFVVRARRKSSD